MTFEPDPDKSPDAGTGLLSPLSYKLRYAEFYVWLYTTYWRGPTPQRRVVLEWLYSVAVETTLSEVNALHAPSALLVVGMITSLYSSDNENSKKTKLSRCVISDNSALVVQHNRQMRRSRTRPKFAVFLVVFKSRFACGSDVEL